MSSKAARAGVRPCLRNKQNCLRGKLLSQKGEDNTKEAELGFQEGSQRTTPVTGKTPQSTLTAKNPEYTFLSAQMF